MARNLERFAMSSGFWSDCPRRRAARYSAFSHFFSHFAVTAYATIAIALPFAFPEWSFAELLALAAPGALLYGLGAPIAGWLGDRWSRSGMIAVFLVGIGIGGIVAGLAPNPVIIGVGLGLIGLFGSIYHPVGFAWLTAIADKPGAALAVNGLFGTSAIALAPILTGLTIDLAGWRAASIIPAVAAIGYGVLLWRDRARGVIAELGGAQPSRPGGAKDAGKVFFVLAVTISAGGFVVQGLPYILPKLFEDRAPGLTAFAAELSWLGDRRGGDRRVSVGRAGQPPRRLVGRSGELEDRLYRAVVRERRGAGLFRLRLRMASLGLGGGRGLSGRRDLSGRKRLAGAMDAAGMAWPHVRVEIHFGFWNQQSRHPARGLGL